MNSPICHKYERRLNDEIATGEFLHDPMLEMALKNSLIHPDFKIAKGIPTSLPLNLHDVTGGAMRFLHQIRFIYLCSLMLEGFVKNYIEERSVTTAITFDDVIRSTKSSFNKANEKASLYNVKYTVALLKNLYKIDIAAIGLSKIFIELGPLRNCIVHDGGIIPDSRHLTLLSETIAFLKITPAIGEKIEISKEMMAQLIEDFRTFLRTCDY